MHSSRRSRLTEEGRRGRREDRKDRGEHTSKVGCVAGLMDDGVSPEYIRTPIERGGSEGEGGRAEMKEGEERKGRGREGGESKGRE